MAMPMAMAYAYGYGYAYAGECVRWAIIEKVRS